MKTNSNRFTVLPTKLVEDLENLSLSTIQYNKAILLLDVLKQKSTNKFGSGYTFGESKISQKYFKSAFTSKYTDFLNPLIEAGIIIQGRSYSVNKGIAKGYSISDRYENSEEMEASLKYLIETEQKDFKVLNQIKQTENKIVSYKVKVEKAMEKKDKFFSTKFAEDFKTLKIDKNKLTEITVARLANLNISSFNVDKEILAPAVMVNFNEVKAYFKTEEAIKLANENNKSLIQDKGNYYIENIITFITRKTNNIYNSYSEVITKLDKKYYYASRNTTNNRLDTNITSMCSEFMKVIKEDNSLVELDMSNSQFAILSHIMPDLGTEDFKLFKKLSFSGELYTYIQDKLSLGSRKDAKNITFQVLFGSEKQKTEGINQFSQLFPSVLVWINEYKKENGYKNFSIMLQKEEAKIFVDEMYVELKSKGLFCITKHDSLIIRKENLEEVSTFVEEYFNSIGFEGTLKVG